MGACFSSNHGEGNNGKPKEALLKPFAITVAFPNCDPITLTVAPSEKLSSVRKRVVAEMERRSNAGEAFCKIEGKLVTADTGSGDTVHLRENMTASGAQLEPKQYLWFQDKNEDSRLQNLLLRSSRLTENTSRNSRGVKQGMAMMKEEDNDGVDVTY